MILTATEDLLQIINTHSNRTLEVISINKSLTLEGPISIRTYSKHNSEKTHSGYYSYGIFDGFSDEEMKEVYVLELGYNEKLIFRNRAAALATLLKLDEELS